MSFSLVVEFSSKWILVLDILPAVAEKDPAAHGEQSASDDSVAPAPRQTDTPSAKNVYNPASIVVRS